MLRATTLIALALLSASAMAEPFPKADPKVGEKLVKEKNCEACHVKLMGGDGSGIYTRQGRLVTTPQALLQRVGACSAQTNAGWFPEDEANVAAYLNQRFYKFK
jgi:cytochrome c